MGAGVVHASPLHEFKTVMPEVMVFGSPNSALVPDQSKWCGQLASHSEGIRSRSATTSLKRAGKICPIHQVMHIGRPTCNYSSPLIDQSFSEQKMFPCKMPKIALLYFAFMLTSIQSAKCIKTESCPISYLVLFLCMIVAKKINSHLLMPSPTSFMDLTSLHIPWELTKER